MATGTIKVDPSSDLRLGGIARFDVTDAGLKGRPYPMVGVMAFQNGEAVYGELISPGTTYDPDTGNFTLPGKPVEGPAVADVKLGGDMSQWVVSGGPADCKATLYMYEWRNGVESITPLDSVEFQAAG